MELLNDIRNYEKLERSGKIYLIAFLVALSGILSILDTMIPKPLPFIKIGIANMVTLILVMECRYKMAIQVSFLRTIVSSLFIGTFLSYTFLLSFSGAIGAVLFMILFKEALKGLLSIFVISLIGAFFNIVFQGIVVVLFFGLDKGTVFMISAMSLFSLLNGALIGWISMKIQEKFK